MFLRDRRLRLPVILKIRVLLPIDRSDVSFGQIVERTERYEVTIQAPMRVSMQVVFDFPGTSPRTSAPFRANLVSKLGTRGPSGNADDASEGSFVFDCHSHWYSMAWGFGRYTICHGPCPAGQSCVCAFATKQSTCDGWETCWCK